MDTTQHDTTPTRPRRFRFLGLTALALVSLFAMGAAFAGSPGSHCGVSGQWADDPGAAASFIAAKIADRADATEEQEQDIKLIVEGMMTELAPMRAEREAFRADVKSALMRDTVDQAELETLRARALDRADDASVVVTAALGNVASVLTPDQRVDLADDLEKMRDRLQR